MSIFRVITVSLVLLLSSSVNSEESASIGEVTNLMSSMPMAFTANQGQWDEKVKFRADAGGATMWFAFDGAYYQFTRRIPAGQDPGGPDAICFNITEQGGDTTQRATDSWIDKNSLGGV